MRSQVQVILALLAISCAIQTLPVERNFAGIPGVESERAIEPADAPYHYEVVVRGVLVVIPDLDGRHLCKDGAPRSVGLGSLHFLCAGRMNIGFSSVFVQYPRACTPSAFVEAWRIVIRNLSATIEPEGIRSELAKWGVTCAVATGRLVAEPVL